MPVNRSNPMYPDETLFEKSDTSIWRELLAVFVLVGLFASILIWIFVSTQDENNAKIAFMRKCIEFHSADRCFELDKWGRRDLLDRRDSR